MPTATVTTLQDKTKDEADILALIESINQAHHAKDAAAIVAPYTPDAAVFDLSPPLSHRGVDLSQKQGWLDTWDGPIDRESRNFSIAVTGDFAFCHGYY